MLTRAELVTALIGRPVTTSLPIPIQLPDGFSWQDEIVFEGADETHWDISGVRNEKEICVLTVGEISDCCAEEIH
jgi:hypothetical protein